RYSNYFIIFTIIGGIGGLGIGIFIGGMSSKKRKYQYSSEHEVQRSINDYYKKNQYFSEREIPRSIRDYYKRKDR
ncbi:unnamed protein product, partial [marine sediment metagenome]